MNTPCSCHPVVPTPFIDKPDSQQLSTHLLRPRQDTLITLYHMWYVSLSYSINDVYLKSSLVSTKVFIAFVVMSPTRLILDREVVTTTLGRNPQTQEIFTTISSTLFRSVSHLLHPFNVSLSV